MARADTTAGTEATLREDATRNFRAAGREAVPVEVGPAGGQPDQPRTARELDTYLGGESSGGYDLALFRHLTFKDTVVPSFSGLKPESNSWTRNARHYAKGVGFLLSCRIHFGTFP